jgi:hypothetical protein
MVDAATPADPGRTPARLKTSFGRRLRRRPATTHPPVIFSKRLLKISARRGRTRRGM